MSSMSFPIGTQYAPLPDFVPASEFVGDMQRMRDLGFTVVRGFVMWGALEPRPGEYDWQVMDALFAAGARTGMKITMTVALGLPDWFLRRYAGEGVINWEGRQAWPRQRRRPCLHEPVYLQAGEAFVRALVARYRGAEALHSWISMNEPHVHYRDIVCYCQDTVTAFQRWLQWRHDSLSRLNESWGTDYESWEQVEPPDAPLHGWGRYPRWIDWRAFTDDSLARHVQWISEIIHDVDPDHPTHTNLLTSPLLYNPTPIGCDPFRMASAVDSLGCSIYVLASSGDEPFLHSMCIDVIRSAADAQRKECWVTEMQGGPTIWAHQRSVTPTAGQIEDWPWQAIGRGAKGFIYWLWRPRTGSGVSGWEGGEFGLADKLGRARPRAIAAGRTAQTIGRNLDLIRSARHHSEVAILRSQTCYHVAYGEIPDEAMSGPYGGQRRYYTQSVLGAYRMLWDANTPMRFVNPEMLAQGLEGVKALLMPFAYLLGPEAAEGVRRFVERGGLVIADFACAMKNERGEVYLRSPGGLVDVFGAEHLDVESAHGSSIFIEEADPQVPLKDKVMLNPQVFKEVFELRESAKVLARFDTGEPAVVMNRYGQGTAILIGTLAFQGYLLDRGSDWRRIVADMLRTKGVWVPVQIETDDAEGHEQVEVAPLMVQDGLLVVVINHSDVTQTAELCVEGCFRAGRDIHAERDVLISSHSGQTHLSLPLTARQAVALFLAQ